MKTEEKIAYYMLVDSLEQLRRARPNDRSENDRNYAVAITDLEKIIAYFSYYVLNFVAE